MFYNIGACLCHMRTTRVQIRVVLSSSPPRHPLRVRTHKHKVNEVLIILSIFYHPPLPSVFMVANSTDPDETPHMGLSCFVNVCFPGAV